MTPLPQSLSTALALAVATLSCTALAAPATLHVHTSGPQGFNTRSVWIDDGHEVTVVDTQFTPALAEALVADIQRQTKSRIARVIVTHPNPDKFNALSVFHRLGAQSLGSRATAEALPGVDAYKRTYWVHVAKAFTEDSYPRREALTQTFSGRLTVTLANGETLSLHELKQGGVASTQTVVRLDRTGDLVVGDLVSHRTHAWLEGGIVNGKTHLDVAAWRTSLQALTALSPQAGARVFGGRGEAQPVRVAVAEQIAYLNRAEALIEAMEHRLGERRAELTDPQAQGPHIAQLQAQLVQAFPHHAMPELVGYSIYGWLATRAVAR
ncbi:MAG: MBL fold metallo-hydrolase [Inhella sp.]|jgi:glyoxylase-like metal-dependent hydrolase (beta-lactamase superfamily II)|uniref:MBL fold metallo-hydrolase n=1 Tax=Inhella sp. TaxID=1921806 RepID=UPI0022C31DD4|nr:MBL fold metallo-hydrolase [Inhella sp.]MCZ8234786.1 MBL fold metallo-hydrolase [Inhella sp.]